jgi:ABC-type lipoprotein export system ATPase subunit
LSSVIILDRVTKKYGSGRSATLALDDVDFSIPEGQFISVMGPSGCGKTTLLNLIAGLDDPTSGHVTVAGEDLGKLSERVRCEIRLRHIGIVFQSFNLLPRVTVARNVIWRLELVGIRGRKARDRTAALLEEAGVPEAAWDRFPGELSGGEQQRVGMARALATDPKILLADEPTGNLDSFGATRLLDQLRRLNQQRRMVIVLVTHDPQAGIVGHRSIELRDGRVIRDLASPVRETGIVVPFERPHDANG